MAHQVFISYSTKDSEVAEAICNALETHDIRCWMAPRNITPGVKYAEAIVNAINKCQVFLLILSTASNDSPQVEMEVDRAASKNISILSFRVDQVELSKTMEYYLSSRQWLDASTPPLEKHFPVLVRTLQRLMSPDQSQASFPQVKTVTKAISYEVTGAQVLREDELLQVVRGLDRRTGRVVHLTWIKADRVPPEEFLSRFSPLAKVIAQVDSPHLLKILDFGEMEGRAVVVQQAVEGKSLASLMTAGEGLAVDLVVDIARQLGETLESLHKQGLTQVVFDPQGILLTPQDVLQVTDTGIMQAADLVGLMKQGKLKATCYHTPELLQGEAADVRTDFYSLGAVLFTALTGKKPGARAAGGKTPTLVDLLPSRLHPGLPPELDELVARCLYPNPAKRIQSVAEFMNKLNEVFRSLEAAQGEAASGLEDSLVGQTLGNYQLVERLGHGGMATVYKAYEPALDRYVAVKVLPQFLANDPSFSQRFRREAKAVAQLSHPNIIPIYHFGEDRGIAYIVMQLMEGGALKRERGQVYDWKQALRLLLPVTRALEYAHQRGIIHRDIKTSNVLLTEENWPVLADFGLVQMAETSMKLTGTGVGLGTPAYMSPEQGQGGKVDARSDVYSLGIMLYELVTGEVPFKADTPMAVVIKHLTAPMPQPRKVNPAIPREVEQIILKAAAKDPGDRFQSAGEMAAAMQAALDRAVVPKEKEKPSPREKPPVKKKIRAERPIPVKKERPAWATLKFKPVIFLIPVVVVLLVLGAVFGPRLFANQPAVSVSTATQPLATPIASTAVTPVPTEVPYSWKRLNIGEFITGDQISAIVLDPKDSGVIYLGTDNAGIYKSIDAGLSWQPAQNGLSRAPIDMLIIDPQNPQILYAGASSGMLFKTTDAGSSWRALHPWTYEPNDSWSVVAMDPRNSQYLLYAQGNFLYKSADAGETWVQVNQQGFPFRFEALAFSPASLKIYALGIPEGIGQPRVVYSSLDGGATWNPCDLKGESLGPPLLVEATQPGGEIIYLRDFGAQTIQISTDGGASWQPSVENCRTIALDPHGGLVAFCNDKLVKTTDAGQNWEFLSGDATADQRILAISPQSSQVIYAGSNALFMSPDGGQTWSKRSGGLGAARAELLVDPKGAALYLDDINGYLHRSLDGGNSWEKIYEGGSGLAIGAQGELWRAGPDYLLKGSEQGKIWDQIALPLSTDGSDSFQVSADPNNTGLVYLAYDTPGRIFVSKDAGDSWQEYPWSWPAPRAEMGSSLENASMFFAQVDIVYMAPWFESLYSSDKGQTWSLCAESYWPSIGKYRLAIDPRDNNVVYLAVAGGGVYRSLNHCQYWQQSNAGLGSLFVNAIAIDPNDPDTLYAGTDGGAYVSFDGGEQWAAINDGLLGATVVYSVVIDSQSRVFASTPYGIFALQGSVISARPTPAPGSLGWTRLSLGQEFPRDEVTAIQVDPQDSGVIYAGTMDAGVYKTINGGQSWQPVLNGLGRAWIHRLVIDLNDTQTLYASVSLGGIYKTTDGGALWQAANAGIDHPANWEWVSLLVMDAKQGKHLYYTPSNGIFESTDAGGSWNRVQTSPCPNQIVDLVVDPTHGTHLFAASWAANDCQGGIYESDDGGSTWKPIELQGSQMSINKSLWIDSTGEYLYASSDRLYVSSDGGQTWSQRDHSCTDLDIDPQDGRTAYCSQGPGGIEKTSDGGQTWQSLGQVEGGVSTISISPHDPRTLLSGGSGVYLSSDSGQTWNKRSNGLGGSRVDLLIDPRQQSTLYATSKNEIYRSMDSGQTWETFFQGGSDLAFGSDGNTLYVLSNTLDRSSDNGQTWKALDLPQEANVSNLAADQASGTLLLAYGSGAPVGLYTSADMGESWQANDILTAKGEINHPVLYIQQEYGSRVYAVGDWSVHRSDDGGNDWSSCTDVGGWLAHSSRSALAIKPHDKDWIILATQGRGVLISQDGCQSWQQSNSGLGSLFVESLAIDPNNPDTIYAGTDGGAYISFDGGANWNQFNDGLLGATVIYSIVVDSTSNVYAATPYGIFKLESR